MQWRLKETGTYITVLNEKGDPIFHESKGIRGVVSEAWLIAAAPEMLTALKESRRRAAFMVEVLNCKGCAEWLAELDRVITLAEGEVL